MIYISYFLIIISICYYQKILQSLKFLYFFYFIVFCAFVLVFHTVSLCDSVLTSEAAQQSYKALREPSQYESFLAYLTQSNLTAEAQEAKQHLIRSLDILDKAKVQKEDLQPFYAEVVKAQSHFDSTLYKLRHLNFKINYYGIIHSSIIDKVKFLDIYNGSLFNLNLSKVAPEDFCKRLSYVCQRLIELRDSGLIKTASDAIYNQPISKDIDLNDYKIFYESVSLQDEIKIIFKYLQYNKELIDCCIKSGYPFPTF